jgi:hypothetical protein
MIKENQDKKESLLLKVILWICIILYSAVLLYFTAQQANTKTLEISVHNPLVTEEQCLLRSEVAHYVIQARLNDEPKSKLLTVAEEVSKTNKEAANMLFVFVAVVYAQEQDKSKDKQEVAEDFRNNVHMSCMKLYKKDL